jgi:RNA polymerase sigma factor (sigma-70 family)
LLREEDLIQSLKKGDEAAYRSIMELYANMVYNTSLSIVQNTNDAQDITQEVFVQVFQSIQKFEQKSSLKTWIYRIAITKSLDEVKRIKSEKRGSLFTRVFKNKEDRSMPDIPHFHHPGVELEQKEAASILFMAIDKLPDKQKTAFTLHKIEQLSHQEIGAIMKLTNSSIESLIFRAKQNLQKYLETYYTERKI